MYELPTEPDKTPTLIINPSREDFEDQIAIAAEGKDTHQALTLHSYEMKTFPKYIADHIAKHLARKLALRDQTRDHFEDKYNQWLEKIYVRADF